MINICILTRSFNLEPRSYGGDYFDYGWTQKDIQEFPMNSKNQNDVEKHSPFLHIDFAQCFEQLRHYDRLQISLLKFAFSGYAAIVTGSYILLKIGAAKQISFTPVVVLLLTVSFLIGLIVAAMFVRNRYYFVIIARYVNELRGKLSGDATVVFKFKAGIQKVSPLYWNPFSAHALALYLLSVLNSSLLAGAVYINWIDAKRIWLSAIVLVLSVSAGQIVAAVLYLKSQEKQSAGQVER